MSIQVKFRRGTTAEHAAFTGAAGEVTVDTDKKVLVVHDGSTAGGNPQDNAERIKSKAVSVDDFTGKDGYIMAYDETNDLFYLKKDEGGGAGPMVSSKGTPLFTSSIPIPA
jgi:hypothetical protein